MRLPEGVWRPASERRATTNYSPDLPVCVTVAELRDDGPPAQFLLFNTAQFLYICNPNALEREPMRIVDFRSLGPSAAGPVFPICHAHTPSAPDEFDLAVGLSTGEVMLLSLRAQLKAPASSTRPAVSLCLNVDGSTNASRCISLAWLPGSDGTAFVAAHRDGAVLLYHKVVGSSSDTKLLARSSSQHSLRPPVTQLQAPGCGGGTSAAAVSPDGQHVAAACRDGVLRVYACPTGGLVAGFKSYYGGLLCCAWSPDGRYVAAGGEDDMLALYGLAERCVVAVCQGHSSWVSCIAFDPWMCHTDTEQQQQQRADAADAAGAGAPSGSTGAAASALSPRGEQRVYRLASAGQDCQVALWDVVVSEEAVAAAQQASSASTSPERERPGLPISPSKRRAGGSRSDSPTKRVGGGNGGGRVSMFCSRNGSGSGNGGANGGDPGALPAALAAGLIAPPLPRADWPLVTPVAIHKAHPEPASSAVFAASALYTACHGSSVRQWARPPLTQQAVVRRIDSLHSLDRAQSGQMRA